MVLTWQEQLEKSLIEAHGKKQGADLAKKYENSFPPSYTAEYPLKVVVSDIAFIEKLSPEQPIELDLYTHADGTLHVRLFQWKKQIPLSDILPMLENMDLRVESENPDRIVIKDQIVWVSDFIVFYKKGTLELKNLVELFRAAFIQVYLGHAENDGFNKLVLGAGLSWRQIMILRAYAKYLRQVGFRFSQSYIEKALSTNSEIAKLLVEFFLQRNDPASAGKNKAHARESEDQIKKLLDNVSSLDEDRILRRILELIKATMRTNYFQTTADKNTKSYLSLKLSSRDIPEIPLPVPLYEIFIYSTRFEGIHLRNTKVARGGIRWSNRLEDFRTEILGLMKAQTVKNAVIVPSGAKGGFVLKKNLEQASRQEIQAEVIACYTSFISGLLDLTDNIKDNKNIPPKQVVCYDDPDPYLVVAADKGTATFSDTANGISKEYNFWMGDAFASGGSAGYDHKKMGITARGAWESVKRHFRELDINAETSAITVVGIGDMSGDVFGNGMIYSKHLRLLAAFDHRHIFIDPNPAPEASYQERLRLFNLPTSSWEDYNPALISPGGGVFKRSLKSISLTKEMMKALGVKENTMAPNDVIKAILKAPVDLLFNGGIGTYVKASRESNTDVGDRTNDYTRVDGKELRCKVVGEGGNLGFTQLGRVEYALNGGLINTDFIDNSAGVDCSDHEVNLKILLYAEMDKGRLTEDKRNELLVSLTQEVADLVLNDNYNQALVMSYSAYRSKKNIGLHTEYIKELENIGILNRKVEFLPDDKELLERKAANSGLTRPELAILLAYTKIFVKQEILNSTIPEDSYLRESIETAFPPKVRSKYQKALYDHRLQREIIATQLSNQVVNEMGITFVYRLQIETGATVAEIVRAHAVASHIYGSIELQKLIESLDYKIPMNEQYDMLYNIRNLINLATRWFLHNHPKNDVQKLIDHFSPRIKQLETIIPDLMAGFTKKYLENLTDKFTKLSIPVLTARRIAGYRAMYTALNIIDVATKNNYDLEKTAKIYFVAGERVNLLWFRDQIANDTREGHWNTIARLTLRDELDMSQRGLTVSIMSSDKKNTPSDELIEHWVSTNKRALERWDRLLALLHASSNIEYTMFFIAIRELMGLIAISQRS